MFPCPHLTCHPPQMDGISSEALGIDEAAWGLDEVKGGERAPCTSITLLGPPLPARRSPTAAHCTCLPAGCWMRQAALVLRRPVPSSWLYPRPCLLLCTQCRHPPSNAPAPACPVVMHVQTTRPPRTSAWCATRRRRPRSRTTGRRSRSGAPLSRSSRCGHWEGPAGCTARLGGGACGLHCHTSRSGCSCVHACCTAWVAGHHGEYSVCRLGPPPPHPTTHPHPAMQVEARQVYPTYFSERFPTSISDGEEHARNGLLCCGKGLLRGGGSYKLLQMAVL